MTHTIIGDGVIRNDLEEMVERLNIHNDVKLIDWKKHNQVIRILQESHILISPSITIEYGDQEGISNALKEAMLKKLPVLSKIHGGIPELVGVCISGYLVPERDVNRLTDRLLFLIDYPEKRTELGINGCRFVQEHYNIDKLNDKLVETYRRLIAYAA